jgi:nucleoside-diphosphate-sugar epimerase
MSARHFVTGATGFVGAALVLELLTQSTGDVQCLVRGRNGVTPEERLYAALREAARAYGRDDLGTDIARRCHVVAGDLTRTADTLDLPSGVDTVWHVAASLNFHARVRDATLRHNVEGTATALAIARATGARHYVHFSTAYVAGRRTGLIREEPAVDVTDVNNPYEESKIRAEILVRQETGTRTWILRPGIVIGHSRTYAALTDAGLYDGLVGAAHAGRSGLKRMLGDRPLHVPQLRTARVNLIPVDAVVGAAWRIRCSDTDRQIFHLTNGSQPTVEEVTRAIFEPFGLKGPEYVDSEDELLPVERLLANHPRNRFMRPYLSSEREFDLSNTRSVLGPSAMDYPLDESRLRPYVDWYVASRLPSTADQSPRFA